MPCLDDATKLGLAVQAFLARPPIDPLLDPPMPTEVVRQQIRLALNHLESVGALSETEHAALQRYLDDGTLPAPPSGPDLLTTGIVLTSVVLHLHDVGPGSLFGGMLPALHHVVDAATDGVVHGGVPAAQACASLAAMQVLQGIKSSRIEFSAVAVTGIKSGIKSAIHGIKS